MNHGEKPGGTPQEGALRIDTGASSGEAASVRVLQVEGFNHDRRDLIDELYSRLLEAENRIRWLTGCIRWLIASVSILGVAEILHWVLR